MAKSKKASDEEKTKDVIVDPVVIDASGGPLSDIDEPAAAELEDEEEEEVEGGLVAGRS